MQVISVAVVDDHPLIVEGVAALLQRSGDFALVATGSAAAHITSIAEAHHPDAMIVDLSMKGDAFQAISDALKAAPGMKFVVFTASTSATDALQALDVGARGYVVKGSPANDLFDAITAARRGEIYISPSVSAQVLIAIKKRPVDEQLDQNTKLNLRECQLIQLLLRGKKNREIACALSLSEKTVKGYMTSLMQKLNARNRVEVVVAAQRLISQAHEARDVYGFNRSVSPFRQANGLWTQ